MAWLRRLFGAAAPEPQAAEPAVARALGLLLPPAGVQAGGNGDLTTVEQALGRHGFALHEAARAFLQEHHGLAREVPIAGFAHIEGFVHFAPEMALLKLTSADLPRIATLMPRSACPVGTTSGHTMQVFLDEDGRSYLLDLETPLWAELAATPAELAPLLCDGRNGRVDSWLLDEDYLPGDPIRAGAEHACWQLERFSHIAPYLPPESLSPGRRPPTARPMVKAVEDGLARGGPAEELTVTCGGFLYYEEGRCYFVSHCENSRYVRAKANLRVTDPPPGVADNLRTGEIVPFQPPPGW